MSRSARIARPVRRDRESGQETLQAIMVFAFVLLPILAAIFTFGALVHTYIAAQGAAAAGARAAGASGGFGSREAARVDDELRANGIEPSQCDVAASAHTISLDQPVAVTVSCPQHIGIPFILSTEVSLRSTFVARGEVNQ